MARLTMLTGRISQVHWKNMQNFPFIFFNAVKNVEIDYTIATNKEDESWVKYSIELDLSLNENLVVRYKHLESSIQTLFWKDVKIEVILNGDSVFKSEALCQKNSP